MGGARDYHAMDWYRTVKNLCKSDKKIKFITDSIDGEGFTRIINPEDDIIELFNIDWILFPNQSKYGNLWRNIVKLIFLPFQVLRLKIIAYNNPQSIFHAIPMYYMFLCWVAGVPYIGTPQGSEILIRPYKSKLYKYFAKKCLKAAQNITVDSINMSEEIYQLCRKKADLVQNGIDIDSISNITKTIRKREKVVSIRGFTPLYRINEIFDARENSVKKPFINFIYPFGEDTYKEMVLEKMYQGDSNFGRLSKKEMYELLASSKLAISIPMSDSSPRSVYEAIFCGCCVAVTYNPWIDTISDCMKKRLYIVDLQNKYWLDEAVNYAEIITSVSYEPSEEALSQFDQKRTLSVVVEKYY